MGKIGTVYGDIAKAELRVGRFGILRRYTFSDDFINCILSCGSFDDIENIVAAQFSIDVAISALEESLEDVGVALPEDFFGILVYNKAPERNAEVKKCINALELAEVDEGFRAHTALCMLEKVHRQQAMSSVRALKDLGEYYRLLPTTLVGFDSIISAYYVVKPILRLLNLCPKRHSIRERYKNLQREIATLGDLFSREKLTNYITNMCRFDRTMPDLKRMADDKDILDIMVSQVLEHSPGLIEK